MFSTIEEAVKFQLLALQSLGMATPVSMGKPLTQGGSSDEGVSGWIPFPAV